MPQPLRPTVWWPGPPASRTQSEMGPDRLPDPVRETNTPGRVGPGAFAVSLSARGRQRAVVGPRVVWLGVVGRRDVWLGSGDPGTPRDGVAQTGGLGRRHLDDQAATALQWHPKNDPPTLLRHLQRSVSRPGLHSRHGFPSLDIRARTGLPRTTGGTDECWRPLSPASGGEGKSPVGHDGHHRVPQTSERES